MMDQPFDDYPARSPSPTTDVAFEERALGPVVRHRQGKAHPGERRAQVVADAREHQGALFDLALDPGPHREEGVPGASHFGRAGG